jgi:hypothetical protein
MSNPKTLKNFKKKTPVLSAITLATMLSITCLTAVPAQALTSTSFSTVKTENVSTYVKKLITLTPTVVPPSGKGTKTVALTGVPKNATSVKINVRAKGAWRDTKLTAVFGSSKTVQTVFTARTNEKKNETLTFTLPAGGTDKIVLTSSQASLAVEMEVVGYTILAPKPAPAPVVKPAPVATTAPVAKPAPVATTAPVAKPAPVATTAPVVKPTPVATTAPTPVSTTPDQTNTGVPAGTKLTVHNGDLKITTPGTVIDGLDIHGFVVIAAPNVTIKNSVVRGYDHALTGIKPLINNLGGHANLVVKDTELSPTVETPYVQGIYGYNFEATRVNIHNVIDGIHITGSNVKVQQSWVHDHLHYLQDPNHKGSPSHDDSIQIQKGDNIVITGNKLTGPHSANMQITQDTGVVSNVTFTKNIVAGGACSVNVAEKGKGSIIGLTIADNKFARDTRLTNCAVISPITTKIQLDRNYYTPDDTLVTVRKG